MAEALLNKLGRGQFHAFSAGSEPKDQVNANAIETLSQAGYDTQELRSKSWNEFVTVHAPRLDAVITLCDSANKARCPIWYSTPVQVHWSFADPDQVVGDGARVAAFRRLFGDMEQQILKLTALDLKGLGGNALKAKLASIAPKS